MYSLRKKANKVLTKIGLSKKARISILKIGIKKNIPIENSPETYLKKISVFPVGTSIPERIKSIDKTSAVDLSIIIAAYNVEKYINKCLMSLINQDTSYKYEIIVINDGSSDRTLEKIKKIKVKSEAPIKIINQANKGFSGARNTGILNCNGNYISFVDADDYVNSNFVEKLMNCAVKKNADIVEGNYQVFDDKSTQCYLHHRKTEVGLDPFNGLYGYPWGKVYKTSLFENVKFPENFWYEDTVMMYRIWPHVKVVCGIQAILYNYRINPNGITITSQGEPKSLDSVYITAQLLKDCYTVDNKLTQNEYLFTLQQMKMNFKRIADLDEKTHFASFLMMSDILSKYFSNSFSGETTYENKLIEKSVRERNYPLFVATCLTD